MYCYHSDSLYHIFGEIIRLHYHRSHNLLDKLGIYPGQPPMLLSLYHKDGQSQKELAEKIKIKPATITVMLGRMEKSELVTRRQDTEDQRISRVYLTEKGKKVCEELKQVFFTLGGECFSNFTDDEKESLRKLLMKMRDNLVEASENKLDI